MKKMVLMAAILSIGSAGAFSKQLANSKAENPEFQQQQKLRNAAQERAAQCSAELEKYPEYSDPNGFIHRRCNDYILYNGMTPADAARKALGK